MSSSDEHPHVKFGNNQDELGDHLWSKDHQPPSPPPESHVYFDKRKDELGTHEWSKEHQPPSPPPESHVYFDKRKDELGTHEWSKEHQPPSPPPESHVYFDKRKDELGNHEWSKDHQPPSPPPSSHVYFDKRKDELGTHEWSKQHQPPSPPPSPPPTPPGSHHGIPVDDDDSALPPVLASPSKTTATTTSSQQSSATSTPRKLKSKSLRGNLMRELNDRDPLIYYEVISVLGVGSMGSVAKVRKRAAIVGGSARKDLQERFRKEKKFKQCFDIPFIGGLFRFCLKNKYNSIFSDVSPRGSEQNIRNMVSSEHSTSSSLIYTKNATLEDYNDGHDEPLLSSYQQIYAMKSIHLSRVTDPSFVDELKNEIHILRTLDHPHIVRPIETFSHKNQIFMIMELCVGGDLYARDPYTEEEAARITSSILSAISYMHSREILHRDLKFENILFVNNSPKAEVKLIDFGLSKVFSSNEELTEGVGTIYTMSPEVLAGSYTMQADLWSVGVIAYMLLSSQMPFYGRKRSQIIDQITNGNYSFRGRRWKKISPAAKEFVRSLLVVDPDDRATADEAFRASWLNRRHSATVRNPHSDEYNNAAKSLANYSNYSKLKKVALMVIAHKSTTDEIGILRKVFMQYDVDKNGVLSYEEFKKAFDAAGYSEEECERMFDACDLDGSGKIRYTEFLAATIEAQGAISEERLAEAFDRLDSDDSGFISAANLKELLGNEFSDLDIDEIIQEVDFEKDGKVSYNEFLALWENQSEAKRDEVMKDIEFIESPFESDHSADSTKSDLSSDEIVSRATFIERKRTSVLQRQVTPGEKHVFFKQSVTTIPGADKDEAAQDTTKSALV